jgi:hypothetical protein
MLHEVCHALLEALLDAGQLGAHAAARGDAGGPIGAGPQEHGEKGATRREAPG